MKKVLLASTALVAFAGAAAAEVKVSGTAIMSMVGGDGLVTTANTNDGVRFLSSADVGFTMTGETDSGLSFGAYIELDEAGLTEDANESVFISGAFGKITMGDTNSALDQVMAETVQGSVLTDEYSIHAGAFANFLDESVDNTVVRYDYAMGDLALAASIELDSTDKKDIGWALGASYKMAISGGSVTFSGGYQVASDYAGFGSNHSGVNLSTPASSTTTYVYNAVTDTYVAQTNTTAAGPNGYAVGAPADAKVAAIGASLALDNGLSAAFQYATIENFNGLGNDADQWGLGASYTTGALTVGASYGEINADQDGADIESWGLGASYDLGGGASVFAGGISEKFGGGESLEKYQAGLKLKF